MGGYFKTAILPPMIQVTPNIALDDSEVEETFIRASGPGGQNVNKVSTAVQLRFDVRNSPSLPEDVRRRLEALGGHRLTQDGVLIITARGHRTQDRNRQEARERLIDLIRQATVTQARRRPTKPSMGARKRRVEAKKKRGTIKSLRQSKPED